MAGILIVAFKLQHEFVVPFVYRIESAPTERGAKKELVSLFLETVVTWSISSNFICDIGRRLISMQFLKCCLLFSLVSQKAN